jgi:hypothetical protein
MPMMEGDGFLDTVKFVNTVANNPTVLDFALQNLVSSAIATAALLGNFTCTVNVSAYSANSYDLVNRLIQRLVNLGYTASLATSTLTVNWGNNVL